MSFFCCKASHTHETCSGEKLRLFPETKSEPADEVGEDGFDSELLLALVFMLFILLFWLLWLCFTEAELILLLLSFVLLMLLLVLIGDARHTTAGLLSVISLDKIDEDSPLVKQLEPGCNPTVSTILT